jgi:tRNA (cmo5U34)-methyltransferase
MNKMDNRYAGSLGEDYDLLKLALPCHDQLQGAVGDAVAAHCSPPGNATYEVLEIGCGDGFTTRVVLSTAGGLHLTAIDSNLRMVEKARQNLSNWSADQISIILSDALDYLENVKSENYHIVFSALTLHNFDSSYREGVIGEIIRVLKPGGLFINGDKYVGNDQERFIGLQHMVKNFFNVYSPLGKFDLLEDLVLHNIADQAPERVMRETDSLHQLSRYGFNPVSVLCRFEMQAVITAQKPVKEYL